MTIPENMYQLYQCRICNTIRTFGFALNSCISCGQSEPFNELPLLWCDKCQAAHLHSFIGNGVRGRTERARIAAEMHDHMDNFSAGPVRRAVPNE